MRTSKIPRWSVACLLGAAIIAACAYSTNPITGRREAYAYSWSQEVQIGRQADGDILRQYGLYEDEEVRAYVERVGRTVLEKSHLRRPEARPEFQGTEFTFRVLDSPVVNAFALPGGFVYVTRGLLAHLENEAQLAVVLGHEVGHVVARHASDRALKAKLGQLGLMGGAVLGQAVFDIPAENILDLGGQAMGLLLMSYGRDDEREADRLGVEYAAMSGYDAGEGSEFFRSLKRIQREAGASLPEWQSTHPDPGERESTIRDMARRWQASGYEMSRVDRDELYDRVDRIVVGDDPRQGFVADGVFYHPVMRFRFPVPEGWHMMNQPTQLQFVEPATRSAALIFQVASDASSAEEALNAFVSRQGVTVVSRERVSVGGYPAHTVVADVSSEQGPARFRRTWIDFNSTVIDFVGVASQQGFAEVDAEFRASQLGFGPLTDARFIEVAPVRVDVTRVSRAGALESFLPSNLPSGFTPTSVAILNQLKLRDTVPSGGRIKLLAP